MKLAPVPNWLLQLFQDGDHPQAAAPVGETIPDGQRNVSLTSLAGTMRRRGMSQEAIEAALLAENARCIPSLPKSEVLTIARSVSRYEPAPDADPETEIERLLRDLTPETPPSERLRCLAGLVPPLARMGHLEAGAILEDLRERLKLRGADLADIRADIKAARKSRGREQERSPRENTGLSADFPGLVDLVEDEGEVAFLMKTDGLPFVERGVEVEGQLLTPPSQEQIPWLLPRAQEVLKHLTQDIRVLFDELTAYFKEIAELPGEPHYDLWAAWAMHTHLLEQANYSPEMCSHAIPERGKTRLGKAAIHIARRGIHVESLRDAYLVRVAHNFQAALFFDVMDVWEKSKRAGSEDIILHRYERGAVVPRVLYPERGAFKDTVYYRVFGPTIIATNVSVHNILETRAIQITMPESRRNFTVDPTPELALPLKEKLTAFRARFLHESFPEVDSPAFGRLGNILKPIRQIIRLVCPDREKRFMALVREIEQERYADRADTLEAQIVLALKALSHQVVHGILPTKDITDHLNKDRTDREKLSYQRMGRRLKALGFGRGYTVEGNAAILWNGELLENLLKKYGLSASEKTPVTPVSSQRGENMAEFDWCFGGVSCVTPETPGEAPGETPGTPEKHQSGESHELCISGVTGVTGVFSEGCGRKKINLLSRARPSTRPLIFTWNQERQRRAAAMVRQAPARDDDLKEVVV
jgi:hypothetical protein